MNPKREEGKKKEKNTRGGNKTFVCLFVISTLNSNFSIDVENARNVKA